MFLNGLGEVDEWLMMVQQQKKRNEEEEMDGADITHHDGKAYPIDDTHNTITGNGSVSQDVESEEKEA